MPSRDIPEREPAPDDVTYTTGQLGRLTDKKRQTIDKAIRDGRLPAYRWPNSRRIWINAEDIPARYRPATNIEARLDRLERAVQDLQASATNTPGTGRSVPLQSAKADEDSVAHELTKLRADNATLLTINQILLAEAAQREDLDRRRDHAAQLLRDALAAQEEVTAATRESRNRYREALTHTQLPSTPPESP